MRSTILPSTRNNMTMFAKGSASILKNQPKDRIFAWLNTFDSVLTDCDGVLWIYSDVIEGSVDVMNAFKNHGKKIYFCTNNSTKTRKQYLAKATEMGYKISEEEIISTAHSTAAYLSKINFNKKIFLIGSEGLAKEFENVGINHTPIGKDYLEESFSDYIKKFKPDPDVGAVVVGFDEQFNYIKLLKAASYLNNPECLFIVTNTDERFPMPNLTVPGTGSIVAAVRTCTDRAPIVIGKPNSSICEWLIEEKIIDPKRTLMIGDRMNTDILLGHNCGFQTLLVGTGVHSLDDIKKYQKSTEVENMKLVPDVYVDRLGDLLPYLNKSILEDISQKK